jgi:hypothetical protein
MCIWLLKVLRGRHGRDRMVVRFTATYATSAYHHWCGEFESLSGRGVLDTPLCDKVCQWLGTCRLFLPGTPVSSTNNIDRHDINEILLKESLNTINQTNKQISKQQFFYSSATIYHFIVWFFLTTHGISNKMKNKKYHTVETVPKSNRKTKNTTLSKQFQSPIEKQKIPHCRNSSNVQ